MTTSEHAIARFRRLSGAAAIAGGVLFAWFFPALVIDVNEDESWAGALVAILALAGLMTLIGLIGFGVAYSAAIGLMGTGGIALAVVSLALMFPGFFFVFFLIILVGLGAALLGLAMLRARVSAHGGAALLALSLPGGALAWALGSALGDGTFRESDGFTWSVIAFGTLFGLGMAWSRLDLFRKGYPLTNR